MMNSNNISNTYNIRTLEDVFHYYDNLPKSTRDLIKYHQLNIDPGQVSDAIILIGLRAAENFLYNSMTHKKDYKDYRNRNKEHGNR